MSCRFAVLFPLLTVGILGCGAAVEDVEQPDIQVVHKHADSGVKTLREAIDKNQLVPQACVKLAQRLRWLKARWVREQTGQASDPSLEGSVDNVATALDEMMRLGEMSADASGPPKLSAEHLDRARTLADQAQQVIDRMKSK